MKPKTRRVALAALLSCVLVPVTAGVAVCAYIFFAKLDGRDMRRGGTKDFQVVEALSVGMTAAEAKATIESYGFKLEETLERPTDGWPKERTHWHAPGWSAGGCEAHHKRRIERVEYYPVGHGLFGFAELFLFYDETGHLVDFRRIQIN